MKPSAILIGLAAGCTAALLFAGVVLQSTSAIFLSLIAPLPILLASLGWGSAIGFLAAFTAGLLLGGITGSPTSGFLLFVSIALPAAIIGHVAGLARPAERQAANDAPPALDWFPVPRILLAIALISAAACLFVGWLVGYDPVALGTEIAAAFSSQLDGDTATQGQVESFARQIVNIIPFLQPALLTGIMALCLYAAAAVARMSGKLARPRDDLPTSASALPAAALPIFAVGLGASFVPGTLGMVGAVVAGALGMAFTLAGLAAIHRMTRATRSRGLILFALYMSIMILTLPLLMATVIGLSETARRARPPRSPST